jgi:glyoxylase-like metal-dependent hydrolase (beta-lactamase superfamily II)
MPGRLAALPAAGPPWRTDMSTDQYEIYAIRYAHLEREARGNFIDGDAHDSGSMPLDYFVWAVVGEDRTIVVDTGFGAPVARRRGRTITAPVDEGLAAIGIEAGRVSDVVITHLHYDHCGNDDMFADAVYHLQDAEMEYATGRCMCHHAINHAFEADDVARMVKRVYAGRVRFHDGTDELAPGITIHRIGGHTKGLQVVRVATARGPVVLASDASHFYAHFEQRRAFPVLYNLAELLAGYATLEQLAASRQHIIPGHDPLVIARYPAASDATAGWIARVDLEPGE